MGIPIVFIGIVLFAVAYQGQLTNFAKDAETDIKGFLPWLAAMAAIGAIGLIPKGKPVSNALFGLVFLVLFVANKGIFANIKSGSAFKAQTPPTAPAAPGSSFTPPAAGPGVKQQGSFGPGQAGTGQTAAGSNNVPGGALTGSPGSNGNVIPLFGGALGSLKGFAAGFGTGIGTDQGGSDSSGVTIEDLKISPIR